MEKKSLPYYATNSQWPVPNRWHYTVTEKGRRVSDDELERAKEVSRRDKLKKDVTLRGKHFLSAVAQKNITACEALLRNSLFLEVRTDFGATACMLAAALGDMNMLKLLMDAGADVLVRDSVGATPLMYAAAHGHTDVVMALLGSRGGANAGRANYVNMTSRTGETAAMSAAKGGYLDTLKVLQTQGGDLLARNTHGADALMFAAGKDHVEVVKYLQSAGASLTQHDRRGWTPLMFAARGAARQVVDYILSVSQPAPPTEYSHNDSKVSVMAMHNPNGPTSGGPSEQMGYTMSGMSLNQVSQQGSVGGYLGSGYPPNGSPEQSGGEVQPYPLQGRPSTAPAVRSSAGGGQTTPMPSTSDYQSQQSSYNQSIPYTGQPVFNSTEIPRSSVAQLDASDPSLNNGGTTQQIHTESFPTAHGSQSINLEEGSFLLNANTTEPYTPRLGMQMPYSPNVQQRNVPGMDVYGGQGQSPAMLSEQTPQGLNPQSVYGYTEPSLQGQYTPVSSPLTGQYQQGQYFQSTSAYAVQDPRQGFPTQSTNSPPAQNLQWFDNDHPDEDYSQMSPQNSPQRVHSNSAPSTPYAAQLVASYSPETDSPHAPRITSAHARSQDLGPRGAVDLEGYTALHHAVIGGDPVVVKALLEAGLDIDPTAPLSRRLVYVAAKEGSIEVLQWLLSTGAGLDDLMLPTGYNPLFAAVRGGHLGVIDVLLRAGARIEVRDSKGRTPLAWAALHGKTAIALYLVSRGASLLAQDWKGRVPRQLAAEHHHTRTAEALRSSAASAFILPDDQVSMALAADKAAAGLNTEFPKPAANIAWLQGNLTEAETFQVLNAKKSELRGENTVSLHSDRNYQGRVLATPTLSPMMAEPKGQGLGIGDAEDPFTFAAQRMAKNNVLAAEKVQAIDSLPNLSTDGLREEERMEHLGINNNTLGQGYEMVSGAQVGKLPQEEWTTEGSIVIQSNHMDGKNASTQELSSALYHNVNVSINNNERIDGFMPIPSILDENALDETELNS